MEEESMNEFGSKLYKKLEQNKELWDLFTRKEEYSQNKLDKYDRFGYANSGYKRISEAIVSDFMVENGLEIEYPDNKKFAICLTHDVDDVYPPFQHIFLSSLYCMRHFDINEIKKQLIWVINKKKFSPYINFEKIIALEDLYNAKSSFYFMSTDRDIRRFRYNIEDLEIELGFIIDSGWEVGLHGGFYAYNDLRELKKEKKRLEEASGKEAIGYRSHYLRFKVPDTWNLLYKAGFKYDTTLGYPDTIGFRNGMCHPFKPFDLNCNKQIDIFEIPLNIMDGTLFHSARLTDEAKNFINPTNSFDEAWHITKNLIDSVEKCHGIVTLLWHNYVFNCPFRENWSRLYKKILDYCDKKNAWMTNGEEIYNWWIKNGYDINKS
jgi:peptidoglycan/xylan/chitin deacetylase (PgdA/CDA1 family)